MYEGMVKGIHMHCYFPHGHLCGNPRPCRLVKQGAKSGVLHDLYGLKAQGRMHWERAGTAEWFRLMRLGDHASIQTSLTGGNLRAKDFGSRGEEQRRTASKSSPTLCSTAVRSVLTVLYFFS